MIAASLVHCDQEDNDSDNDSYIYTYRGDRQEPPVENLPMDDRSASPLMDYLEMDFEPEPTVNNVSEDEEIAEQMAEPMAEPMAGLMAGPMVDGEKYI